MKLPSIQQLLRASGRTFMRFPVVIVDAFIGTTAAIILIEHEAAPEPSVLFPLLFATALGIPFFTALTLFAERRKHGRSFHPVLMAAGVVLLTAYAFTVPAEIPGAPELHAIRLVLLAAALHFFVAVAPFAGKGEVNGFWQFNMSLGLRIIAAGLFAAVLFCGLAIALAALNNLFGMDVPGRRYFQLWVFIAGIFATWFFLAGVPEDLGELETSTVYHKGLKTFAQYILFPILLVYLVILYAYVVKIIADWSWPNGWVSGLILSYAATGLLLLLLVHPLRDREGNAWIRPMWRWFFISMVPLVIMLCAALWRRISEYGFTEDRYFGALLALWLAAMVPYFIFGKGKNIKTIPGSLCVLALLAGFGPWGAFSVSESSQVERLRALLERNGMMEGGMVTAPRDSVTFPDRSQISSIITYLRAVHGYDRIQPWFSEDLTVTEGGAGRGLKRPGTVVGLMGIEYTAGRVNLGDGRITLVEEPESVTDISGYDRVPETQHIGANRLTGGFAAGEMAYRADGELDSLTVILSPAGRAEDSVSFRLMPLVDRLLDEYPGRNYAEIPAAKMWVAGGNPGMKVKVSLKRILLRRSGGNISILSYEADIFYSIPEKP